VEDEEASPDPMNNLPKAKNQPFRPAKATFSNEGNKSFVTNKPFKAEGSDQISESSAILYNMPPMKKHNGFRQTMKKTKITTAEDILRGAPTVYNRTFEPAYITEPDASPASEIFRNMPHANNKKFQPASVSEEYNDVSAIMEKIPRAKIQRFQPAHASDFFWGDTQDLVDGRASRSDHFEPRSPSHPNDDSRSSDRMSSIPKAKNRIFRPAVSGDGGRRTFKTEFQKAEKGTDEVMRLMDSVPRNRERFRPSPVMSNDPYSPALRAEVPSRSTFNPLESFKSSKPMFKPSKPKW